MTLLVGCGAADPNLEALVSRARERQVEVVDVRIGTDRNHGFHWDLETCSLFIDERPVHATAAFLRLDVFASMSDPRPTVPQRANGWFHAIQGWVCANPEVLILNRTMRGIAGNKPATLLAARRLGLHVPSTVVTNLDRALREGDGVARIAKPVAGGDYCYALDTLRQQVVVREGAAATPAIVQSKMVSPEVRVYIIGNDAHAFEMRSPSLDYRRLQDVTIVPVPVPERECLGLRRLMDESGMNYGAADFKTDPESGRLAFLELNTSPMFARFDAAVGGAVCDSILRSLCVLG